MKLNNKLSLIILTSAATIWVVFSLLSNFMFLQSYDQIEQDKLKVNVQIAHDAIQNEMSQLNVKLIDWAQWDDTYQFIQDKNQVYIDSNLLPETLINLEIQMLVFVDSKGETIFKEIVDKNTGTRLPDDSIKLDLSKYNSLLMHPDNDHFTKGIVVEGGTPFIMVSRPIITSDGNSTPSGSIMFGKVMDQNFIENISKLTHLSVSGYVFSSPSLPADVQGIKAQLSSSSVLVIPADSATITGYTLISDLNGNPAYIIRVDNERTIFIHGNKVLTNYILIVIGISVIGIIVLLLILRRFITGRVENLTGKVTELGQGHDLAKRLDESGKDEISELSKSINFLLSEVEQYYKKDLETEKHYENLAKEYKQKAEQLEKMNTLMVGREIKMAEMKKQLEQAKNINTKPKDSEEDKAQ